MTSSQETHWSLLNNEPSPLGHQQAHTSMTLPLIQTLSLIDRRSELLLACLFKWAENTYQWLGLPIVAAAYHNSNFRDSWARTSGKKQVPGRSESRNETIFHYASEFDTYSPTTPFKMLQKQVESSMCEWHLKWQEQNWQHSGVLDSQESAAITSNCNSCCKRKSIRLKLCGKQPADPEESPTEAWRSHSQGDKCHRGILPLLKWTHAKLLFLFRLFLLMQLQIPQGHSCK